MTSTPMHEDHDDLATLHLTAGRLALRSTAFDSALEFFQRGLGSLGPDAWEHHYALTMALTLGAAESALARNDEPLLTQATSAILTHAHTPLERAEGYNLRKQFFFRQARFAEALHAGMQQLAALGITLPLAVSEAQGYAARDRLQTLMRAYAHDDLVSLPTLSNHEAAVAATLGALSGIMSTITFYQSDYRYALLLEHAVPLFMRYGLNREAPQVFMDLAILFAANCYDLDLAAACGALAQQLQLRFFTDESNATPQFRFPALVRPLPEPLRTTVEGVRTRCAQLPPGDFMTQALALRLLGMSALFSGMTLQEVEQIAQSNTTPTLQSAAQVEADRIACLRQLVTQLRAETAPLHAIQGALYDSDAAYQRYGANSNHNALRWLGRLNLCLNVLFGDAPQAVRWAEMLREQRDSLQLLTPSGGATYLYAGLAYLHYLEAAGTQLEPAEQARYWAQVRANRHALQLLAAHTPANYRHRWQLLEAEIARSEGQFGLAREYYDQALALARQNQFPQDEGLAAELALQCYLARNQQRMAQLYFDDAVAAYQRWGAVAKVRDLHQRYPTLRPVAPPLATSYTFDVERVLKATQAIASEIEFNQLLVRILDVMLEHTGAQRSVLLLRDGQGWVVGAERTRAANPPQSYRWQLLAETLTPLTVVNYVAHTCTSVVIQDPVQQGVFRQDPYLTLNQPRSLICLPLLYRGATEAVLYLEQRLSGGVFTEGQIEGLNILASQAAISLIHAQLYTRMEELIAIRSEDAHRRAEEAETLRQCSATVAATLDPQQAINRILEQLAQVIPHQSSSVQVRRGEKTEVIGCRGFANPNEIIGLRYPITGYLPVELAYIQRLPCRIADVTRDEGFIIFPDHTIRSWLGLPLIAYGKVIGMLTLDNEQPNYFTEDHERIGRAFADQVAIALEHAHLYQEAMQANEQLRILNEVAQAMSAVSLDLDQIFQKLHEAINQLLPADALLITHFFTDGTAEDVVIEGWIGDIGHRYASERSFIFTRLQQSHSALISDMSVNGASIRDPTGTFRAGVVVGIQGSQRLIGGFAIAHLHAEAYNEGHLRLLELLAAHTATALENATRFAEVERLAITDTLTGLFTRRHFFTLARREFERSQRYQAPIALLMIDIDNFKRVNDTYGHQVGDQVLQEAAARCRLNLRSVDIAGRYGGEEFIILLPGTSREGALAVANRIHQAIRGQPVGTALIILPISASFGLSTSDSDDLSLTALITYADRALYDAKRLGKDRIVEWRDDVGEGT